METIRGLIDFSFWLIIHHDLGRVCGVPDSRHHRRREGKEVNPAAVGGIPDNERSIVAPADELVAALGLESDRVDVVRVSREDAHLLLLAVEDEEAERLAARGEHEAVGERAGQGRPGQALDSLLVINLDN